MRNQGKLFEDDFKASVPENVYYLRLHDSATGFTDKAQEKDETIRFSLKSPYDAVLCAGGRMICVELKSVSTTSISFVGNSPRIKLRQVEELKKAKHIGGARAYLIVNFRKYEETYAIDPDAFLGWTKDCGRKSLPIAAARELGIRLPERKLKTHRRYFLAPILRKETKS
jgi:recombination protein U